MKGVFIYENKDTQEYKEIVVARSDLPISEARGLSEQMTQANYEQKLAEPLENCIDQKGWKYTSCPFRDRCLEIREWGDVA